MQKRIVLSWPLLPAVPAAPQQAQQFPIGGEQMRRCRENPFTPQIGSRDAQPEYSMQYKHLGSERIVRMKSSMY